VRRDRFRVTVVSIAVASRALAAQGQTTAEQNYPAEFSTVPMIRNAALVDTGIRLVERGVDAGFDRIAGDLFVRKSPGGFAARLGRWLAFDFFVTGYASVITHEYGHDTRAEELGRPSRVFIRGFNSSFFGARGTPFTAMESLAVSGAGFEGARVLADRVERRIYTGNHATWIDVSTLFMSVVGAELYLATTLSEGRLESPAMFLSGGANGLPGDAATYATSLTAVRLSHPRFTRPEVAIFFPQIQSTAREIRRASFLNLVDMALITGTAGLVRDYMWNGRRDVPVRWLSLGPVSLVPSLRYELTPNGPEHQVRSHYKLGSAVGVGYVRWSAPLEPLQPDARGLWGFGGEYARLTNSQIQPRAAMDIWRDIDGSTRGRVEIGATVHRFLHRRLTFTADVGVKGDGYLRGYALEKGAYFGVGAGIRF
jgi:hypothetical protein